MTTRFRALARRRPALLLLTALYVTITVLVARSPLTVALCTALAVSLVVQVVLALRATTGPDLAPAARPS